MIGGAFEEPDTIHCVRTHVSFETISEGNLMLVKTKGKASDLKPSKKFEAYLDKVKKGLVSPIFKLSSYDGSNPTPVVRRGANMKEDHPLQIFLCSSKTTEYVSINLMNEAKLSPIELSRLYCRRFAFATQICSGLWRRKNLWELSKSSCFEWRQSFWRHGEIQTITLQEEWSRKHHAGATVVERVLWWIWRAQLPRSGIIRRSNWCLFVCMHFNGIHRFAIVCQS